MQRAAGFEHVRRVLLHGPVAIFLVRAARAGEIESDGAKSGAGQVRHDVFVHAAADGQPGQQHDVGAGAAGAEVQLARERVGKAVTHRHHGTIVRDS